MQCLGEDPRVCGLYDKNGYIAGIQIGVSTLYLYVILYEKCI